MAAPQTAVRLATVDDAALLARLQDDFDTEFDAPPADLPVLTRRYRDLLADSDGFALLAGPAGRPAGSAPTGIAATGIAATEVAAVGVAAVGVAASGVAASGVAATGFATVTLRPTIYCDGPLAVLDELYVIPGLRDQGIGTVLLQAVIDEVRARGGGELHINVDEVDTDTRRFYERYGFSNVDPESGSRYLMYERTLD